MGPIRKPELSTLAEDDPGESAGTVVVHSMQVGMDVPDDLYDEHGILLIRGGTFVTNQLVARIKRRGVVILKPAPGSAPPTPVSYPDFVGHTPTTRQLDNLVRWKPFPQLKELPTDANHRPFGRLGLGQLREESAHQAERFQRTVSRFANMASDIHGGKVRNVGVVTDMVGDFLGFIRSDLSLPMLVLDMQERDEYLFTHSMNVALVTMTVATYLGYGHGQVIEAGIGALFQDIGMLRVPNEIRRARRPLNDEERVEINRHPILTVDTLERHCVLSEASLLVGYQGHERCDKSGYPRQRASELIHPLARIAAAADIYAAITCARPHRPAGSPYLAITTVLRETAEGRIDKAAARALIDVMSIFPVGSYVRLSDGTSARVLRSNGQYHAAPVVVPLETDGRESDTELDLARSTQLSIVAILDRSEVV